MSYQRFLQAKVSSLEWQIDKLRNALERIADMDELDPTSAGIAKEALGGGGE